MSGAGERARALALIGRSPLFDPGWYLAHYGDVARAGAEPAAHFLDLGAALGRDPGPGFSTRDYLAANPDVAAAGMNPLLHYLTAGRAEGRAPHPPAIPPRPGRARARLGLLRTLLETGGLDAGPLAGLANLAGREDDSEPAAGAAEALALWHLRQGGRAGGREALAWFARRRALGGAGRLEPLRLMAAVLAGEAKLARRIRAAGPDGADLALAATWLHDLPGARLAEINRALAAHGLSPVRLGAGEKTLYDRLEATTPPVEDGPLVSVLMAAHDAARTLPAALRSVAAQSWRALELLVIDDASTDATADIVREAAARDPRIRLVRLERNRGAYGARNAGLAQARGRFVTLHDADDWFHPARIERQVRFLLGRPGYAGCLTAQARCTPDLRVSRWTGEGAIVHENLSSLMLPRDLLQAHLGGWDEVRVSADSELLRRVRRLFGARSVPLLPDGPLCLQRDSAASATADGATGMAWFYHGARREYYEAQLHHHARAESLRYGAGLPRPFPVPGILLPGRTDEVLRLDTVYAGLLSQPDAGLARLLDWLEADRVAGRRAGLVPLYSVDLSPGTGIGLHPRLRARVDGDWLRVLCHGERVICGRMQRLPGQSAPEPHRYLPHVTVDGCEAMRPGAPPPGG